jgi:hypothetical protein
VDAAPRFSSVGGRLPTDKEVELAYVDQGYSGERADGEA